MVSPVAQIESPHKRLEKVRQIVQDDGVHPILNMDNHFVVEPSTGKGFYLVNGESNCPDAKQRTEINHRHCKHHLATILFRGLRRRPKPLPERKWTGWPPRRCGETVQESTQCHGCDLEDAVAAGAEVSETGCSGADEGSLFGSAIPRRRRG